MAANFGITVDKTSAGLGHEAAVEVIRCMGAYIDKHFGALGGFSPARTPMNSWRVLPNSDLAEVEGILENLSTDFQEQGIRQIQACANKSPASRANVVNDRSNRATGDRRNGAT